jgi:hemerythrin
MPWNDQAYVLGVEQMDDTHREFVALVDQAIAASDDAEFVRLFGVLYAHVLKHFDDEARLMRECRFAATGEHEREHLRILADLAHLKVRVAAGRLSMARAYVEGLPYWFSGHLATMDSALAASLRAARAVPA